MNGKHKTPLVTKMSFDSILFWVFLVTFGSFVRTPGVLQIRGLWGILCAKINFTEQISIILYVFQLEIKIIRLKLDKVKSEVRK